MDELTLLRHIAEAARLTRERQRNYFRTRRPDILELSKTAERQLDDLLAQYHDGAAATQVDLFARPP